MNLMSYIENNDFNTGLKQSRRLIFK